MDAFRRNLIKLSGVSAAAEAYFRSVAGAAVNKEMIDNLKQIADEGVTRFSYVPGNHDMLLTEAIFHAIFPNGKWQGVGSGHRSLLSRSGDRAGVRPQPRSF